VVVNASAGLEKKAAECCPIRKVFPRKSHPATAFFRALRPHQWIKNLVIFVPILSAHQLGNQRLLLDGIIAFAVFCCCASAVYLLNDLMDLDADRQHSRKRLRPFAAGDLSISTGMVASLLLFAAGISVAARLGFGFLAATLLYLVLTTSYSFYIKRVVLLDVFFLAALYTIRLIAGHEATWIPYSAWLLIFSIFIFLSLALVKRYVELANLKLSQTSRIGGRGYVAGDLEIVASLGTGSGFVAALVLALYATSDQVTALYTHPLMLLLLCPLMLYWVSRVWLLAHRGQMNDDPVLFAARDPASYVVGLLALIAMWLATGTFLHL
jgi:4-hydroxybenzoate polyprenyltransferase